MILRRLGNKSKISVEIQKYFPPHKIYIEPFFGAGGMFFNKPKAKYNIVNDLDSDVFNLFMVVMNQKEELERAFYMMPIHSDLLEYWKKNQESEPIKKALRFLLLSNFTFNGAGASLSTRTSNNKNEIISNIDNTFCFINDIILMNDDYRKFIKSVGFRDSNEMDSAFIYSDPPYLGTGDNYSHSFTEQDSSDLFNLLIQSKCKFAVSEFDHPFIIEQAQKNGLNTIIIGERQNLKNRRTEILITNYENVPTLFP